MSAFDYIEEQNRKILNYGWVNFPLAYTQVATLSVYVYMLMSIFGSQYLQVPEAYKSDAYNDTISFSDKAQCLKIPQKCLIFNFLVLAFFCCLLKSVLSGITFLDIFRF